MNSTVPEINRPLRIALVSPYAHYAGHHWPTARELALALRADGHHADIITATSPVETVEPILRNNLWLAWRGQVPGFLRKGTSLAHNLETLFSGLRVLRLQKSRQYDVWHFIDGTQVFIYLAALGAPAAIVYYLGAEATGYAHAGVGARPGWLPKLRSALAARAFRRGKLAMVCATQDIQRSGAALFGNHVYHIPYAARDGVALQDRPQARQKLGLPAEDLVLLLFGTHREGKDYDTVVLAAQRARAKVHLLFAGKTISGNEPAQVVARHGYDHALIVEKFISAQEAPLYFAACDAVVLPYTGNFQKGSSVLLEALQYRRPSLAADTGFLRQFIAENRCGFVFQPGDAADLARVIDELAGLSESQRTELSVRIEEAAQRCSWKAIIKQYVLLYRQLIGGTAADR